MILRHADAGGRPMTNAEFCYEPGRSRVENATKPPGSRFTTIARGFVIVGCLRLRGGFLT
jgi:hypothetical protein